MTKIDQLFENYKIEAFRLEILPEYKIPEEWDDFQQFQKLNENLTLRDKESEDFIQNIKNKLLESAKTVRVRILDKPLTEYQKFEIKTAFIDQFQAGCYFFFISRNEYIQLLKENFGDNFIPQDFWIFDNQYLVVFRYSDSGEWLGYTIVEDLKKQAPYKKLKNLLLQPKYLTQLKSFTDFTTSWNL